MDNQLSLFEPLDRTGRQKECLKAWINAKCKGSIVATTGFGKTRVGLMASKLLSQKYPNLKIIVVVPTDTLQRQWQAQLFEMGLAGQSEVMIINTLVNSYHQCDLLILDEAHRYASPVFSQVFTKVKYTFILALSATMERLDGKHEFLYKYCPVVDRINDLEAIANGWVAQSIEYKVILDVADIEIYKQITKEFNEHFEFFQYNFDLATSMLGKNGYVMRSAYRDKMCEENKSLDPKETFKMITYHATALARALQARKKFINEHPDKIRLTREIIKHRPNAKIITFSATTEIAEKIGYGYVYTGKDSKKKGRITLNEFATKPSGVLNTVKKCDEGLDCPGINLAIILGYDSSPTRYKQRKGRAIRKEGNKISELFTFVINDTVETAWFAKSHSEDPNKKKDTPEGNEPIPINEENLMKVLRGEDYETYKRPVTKFTFRF